MFSLVNIDHIVLNTNGNLEGMLHFYCNILGCNIEREVKAFGLTQLRAGQAIIDLIDKEPTVSERASDSEPNKNLEHFCLTIDQPIDQQLIAYLDTKQIVASEIMDNYGAQGFGPSVYISDPVGNTVELKQDKTR
jgi:catechol-2,3-dioxygenase